MSIPATESAIEVAYWFLNKAEQENIFLENEKIFHLLFAAQINYAQKYNNAVLMPCCFVCEEDGFIEPNLKKIFALGRPYMPPTKLDDRINSFLEYVWNKYAGMTAVAFSNLIKSSTAYKECYIHGSKNMVMAGDIAYKFKSNAQNSRSGIDKKLRFSQNGPVMVSSWNPRKL